MPSHPDPTLIALGIRQPWAELIVRGTKTIEVRTIDTAIRGPIYVYASRKASDHPAALVATQRHDLQLAELPRGLIVGTVEIVGTSPVTTDDVQSTCLRSEDVRGGGLIGWRLANPLRFESPLPVRFLPYGIWFYPFRRKGG